jgi:hypothetical protein
MSERPFAVIKLKKTPAGRPQLRPAIQFQSNWQFQQRSVRGLIPLSGNDQSTAQVPEGIFCDIDPPREPMGVSLSSEPAY